MGNCWFIQKYYFCHKKIILEIQIVLFIHFFFLVCIFVPELKNNGSNPFEFCKKKVKKIWRKNLYHNQQLSNFYDTVIILLYILITCVWTIFIWHMDEMPCQLLELKTIVSFSIRRGKFKTKNLSATFKWM